MKVVAKQIIILQDNSLIISLLTFKNYDAFII